MRINARMTENTSLSLGPIGWLIAGPIILAAVAVFAVAYLAALVAIEIVKLTGKLARLAVLVRSN